MPPPRPTPADADKRGAPRGGPVEFCRERPGRCRLALRIDADGGRDEWREPAQLCGRELVAVSLEEFLRLSPCSAAAGSRAECDSLAERLEKGPRVPDDEARPESVPDAPPAEWPYAARPWSVDADGDVFRWLT